MEQNEVSSFLRNYSNLNFSRFHMPGHQGRCEFLNSNISAKFDLTEISGADFLYKSSGIIKSLESKISTIYECESVISAGGSTLSIQSVISIFKNRQFIACNNSHIAFYNVCALLNISPIFIDPYSSEFLYDTEKLLSCYGESGALYVTSPDYYGRILDIFELAKICKKSGAILIVDGAHGAHLKFLKEDLHPLAVGADICCDSFHKTLPALTGASVVHFKRGIFDKEDLKYNMSIFGTTSPSYVIMDSIGLCIDWLVENGKNAFSKLQKKVFKIKQETKLKLLKTDCSKITLDYSNLKITKEKLLHIFKNNSIEPEFVGRRYVVFIVTPFLNELDWHRLYCCLKILENYIFVNSENYKLKQQKFKPYFASFNNAIFNRCEKIKIENALGRVCGRNLQGEPPGTVAAFVGEKITKAKLAWLVANEFKYIYVISHGSF